MPLKILVQHVSSDVVEVLNALFNNIGGEFLNTQCYQMGRKRLQHLLILLKVIHLDYVLNYVVAELVLGKIEAVFNDLLAESGPLFV